MKLSTRLTLAMIVLVVVTATTIGVLNYRQFVALALPRALDRIDTHARVMAAILEASVRSARADVIGFRASNGVYEVIKARLESGADPAAGNTEADWRRRLAKRFVAELTAKSDYSQIRFIGIADGGREIVRVDRSGPGGTVRAVPDDELQRKGEQGYFKETIGVGPNGVYISPVDLNEENGVIETPHVPTLRASAPVYAPDGRPYGFVIINVDLRPAFIPIRMSGRNGLHHYVVNEHGDYLVHPETNREFGFALGKPFRVQDDFPEFANMLTMDDTPPRIIKDRAGMGFGLGWESIRLAGGPRVIVIEIMPYSQLMAAVIAIRNSSLLGGSAAVLGAIVFAVLLGRSLTRPLVQMTKAVEGFGRNEAIVIPTAGSGEIGVLASAFARMADEMREKSAALKQEIEERRRIFDTSLDLILVTDDRSNVTRVSPSSEAILGYRPDAMIGHSAAEFIYPEDLEPTREVTRLARSGRHMRNFECRYVHQEGRVVTLVWTGVWSEQGQQYFFVGRDLTEQKLAEEKFQLAIEAFPSGLVMIDGNGTIVLVNTETERLFRYGRHELIGQPVDILVPESLRGHHVQHRTGFMAQPKARRMGGGRDLYGLRKDGSEFPIEIGLNPIHTQNGVLVLSVIVDTSQRQWTEAAIREYAERERLFVAAVESSVDAIITYTLDGTITSWNPAAERLFGFSAQDAVGNKLTIIVPENRREETQTIVAKIRAGDLVSHFETVRTNRDGREIDVSISVAPVKSHSGEVVSASAIVRDITESKNTQEALHESEQTARAIIDTALDAFLQLDDVGTIIDWSPKAEAMFGWSRQEAVGQKLRDLIIPVANRAANAERLAQFLRDADKGILGRRYDAPSLLRDGREIDTEVSLTALRRRDGYVINGFIRDISERKAAEEQLLQAQKMESVGQLTGGIAHDFNNMLTVITGTIEILAEAVADKPELAAIATLISEAADRGAELTGHLLAFARKQPLQPRETDINVLMVESAKLLRPALGEHIEIETSLKHDVWSALVDPSQLSSALMNLAINARDAMPNGGKLTLETRNVVLDESYAKANGEVQPGNYVMIAVSDSGTGIPETIREKIFEPFFSTKGVGKGTGLGLSMVYGFVKQSGGHIKVYSEEGHGTTFRIYLPQAVDAQSAKPAEETPEVLIEGNNETILAVEDDPLVRTYVTTQLQSLGYKTIPAANGAEALKIVDSGAEFDLLFTDVIMPGAMNGRQLAEEVAKRRSPLKVLFTSGYTEDAIVHHGRLDPGVLLLTKPYRKIELARMLRVALDASPASDRASATGTKATQVRRSS